MGAMDQPEPCVVLVRHLHPTMLDEIVETLLAVEPGVEIRRPDDLDDPDDIAGIDLVIEGDPAAAEKPAARLLVAPSGSTVCEFRQAELTNGLLNMAVNAARRAGADQSWLGALISACSRIDDLLTSAVDLADEVFQQNGGFDDWRTAFAERRFTTSHDPLTSPWAVESEPIEPLIDRLTQSRFLDQTGPSEHPFGRLVREYSLDGRQIDVLLLCLAHELDPRYGHRYAFLQQDLALPVPTVELVSSLLAGNAAERLDLQRELISGPLVASGLIALGRPEAPHRSRVLILDPTVLRILMADAIPDVDQDLRDPRETPRSDPDYRPADEVAKAAHQIGRLRHPVHLFAGTSADRRSAALDIADQLDRKLLIIPFKSLSEHAMWQAQRLRRECLRLNAICLVEDLPQNTEGWQQIVRAVGPSAISAADDPSRPVDRPSLAQRWNFEVKGPRISRRLELWHVAGSWTGVEVVGGMDELADRYGVAIDRAAAALASASTQQEAKGGNGPVTADAVINALSDATADDAGGLLVSAKPRVQLSDLIVEPETQRALGYACARIRNRDAVIHELGWNQRTSRLTGTYLLFAGPPGTGKTMAGEAIAGELGLPVQYLEISSLLSRWVGDFEAAVDKVFAAASGSGALLLANEADAFLGPRTEVDSAQARYANAGTSHLLSRLEQFTGHVIFTSNLIGANNIDPAFHRRLTATVRFRLPDEAKRRQLWDVVWPTADADGRPVSYAFGPVGSDVASRPAIFDQLARDHCVSGGNIANIAKTATFLAAEDSAGEPITIADCHLQEAVRLELSKIGDFRSLMKRRRAS